MALHSTSEPILELGEEPISASILLVDDHPANLIALEAVLAPLGQPMVRATSGEEALKRLLEREFAVILLDVQMPGADGLQTAALIKQRRRTRNIPIIFLTAIHREDAHVFAGYEQGAVDYLLKPFDPFVLRSKVAVFIDLYRQRETIRWQETLLRQQERDALEQRSQQRFRSLLDAMPQCVWALRPDGTFYYCNRFWLQYSGLTLDQAVHGPIDEIVRPEDRGTLCVAWRSALGAGEPLEVQVRLRRFDGVHRWHLGRAVPERDEQGAIVGWIATATDIDEQKCAEEVRAELLASAQRARNDAERAQREAEAANRAKDEFLATVSHELRTPLNAILGWTRLLRGGMLPEPKRTRALETIERNATVQTQIVGDILDVSRIITGKLRLEFQSVALTSLVENALDAVRPTADAKGIVFNAALGSDSDSIRVSGDPDRLQQVLWNLLSNAIKFTPRGGHIDVQLDKVNSHVELRVRDTGHGIPQDFLPYVFDRFRQADGTSARKYGGLGLGLAIVRHLVELHGGRVQVHSAGEGYGATFTVALPIRAVQTDPRESVHPSLIRESPSLLSDLPSLADLRVLVVDDDADARELVTAVLEPCGADVTAVASVEEALSSIAKAQPDVLVSDIGMAGEDGYVLIRKLRALDPAQGGQIPAAALTAYARPEDRSRILAEGFQLHMAKPVDPAELVAAVGQLAGRWTETKDLTRSLHERRASVS